MEGITKNIFCCLFTVCLVGFVKSAVFQVEKCKLEDASCLLPAIQAAMPVFMGGIPEIGVEVMDVMEMKYFAFDLSGLQFTFRDGTLKGFKESIVDRVKWDLKKKRIEIDYHCNITVKGQYTAAGRLLILPISGEGQLRLKARNLAIAYRIDYKTVTGEDGKMHVKPTKYDFDYEVKDYAHVNMTGLFNGNTELSNSFLNFVNQNWRQVAAEFGKPILDHSLKKLFRGLEAFFKSEAIEDIAVL